MKPLNQTLLLTILACSPILASADELTTCPDQGRPNVLPTDKVCHVTKETAAYAIGAIRTGWVEMDSPNPNKRVFVNFPDDADLMFKERKTKLYLRTDVSANYVAQFKKNGGMDVPPTMVQLLNLDCSSGEETVLQAQVFDLDGKPIATKVEKSPKAVRISRFYESPLAQVCRREFIFKVLENGEIFLMNLKAFARNSAKVEVPDRDIAPPNPAPTTK